ncbi:SDR family oxidoreductase [Streptomyces sp. NPDC049627]|uniref:SDR family oxidoreductase n=1 Tax=Streptomyces sp. NPDC049627 TaxID=3365595 RepID=UPI0037A771F6
MMTLSQKKALVTGGSRGIGRGVVERLAAEGADVAFTYREREAEAKEVVAAVEAAGRAAHAIRVDLTEVAEVRRTMLEAHRLLGGLDILVNNAAAAATATRIESVTEEEFDRAMAVNARAVFFSLQEASRLMNDGGRIINLSTANTALPVPGVSLHAGSKAAVEQYTRVAAQELGARGITVNVISPGATDTELLRANITQEGLELAVRMTPLGRIGEPADIAGVVAFLCGPDGGFVSGQNLRVTGGMV